MSMPFFGWGSKRTDDEIIGDYRLGAIIGQGTFGKVRAAEHVQTGQQVAVKIVDNEKMDREKLQEEIRVQRLLDHQNVVRIFDVVEKGSSTYVVMELLGGGELFEHIVKNVRLCEEEARRVFQQIIHGLDHCHHRNVVHRDLKPENILLDSELNVKLADFGFGAELTPGELLTDSCGSPNYAAPELLYRGCKYEGPEVDVWSCGVVLYTLLCGALPFDAEGFPELFRLIKKAKYSVPGFLSDEAKDLIAQMLCVDPAKRISVSEIRRHAWFGESTPTPEADVAVPTPEVVVPTPEVLLLPAVFALSPLETLVEEKSPFGRSSVQNFLALSAFLVGVSSATSKMYTRSRAGKVVSSPSCRSLGLRRTQSAMAGPGLHVPRLST